MQTREWSIIVAICAIVIQAFVTANSLPEADKITKLPGQPEVSFQQYAGYITVDKNRQRQLFYYFAEAQSQPASKPLVLWLNGGPGCSSLGAGAFIEHGPFKPSGDILLNNAFSWNTEANMLYLESPAGVGFSYSSNETFYGSVNDVITARDNLAFLERWFDKFPEYKNRDFFITGESYGGYTRRRFKQACLFALLSPGHYVPELAQLIIQSKLKFINLKGIAIGNPLLEFNSDFNSGAEYLWSHGLLSDATFESLTSVCNFSQMVRQSIENGRLTPVCAAVSNQVDTEVSNFINGYDITLDICLSSAAAQSHMLYQLQETSKIDVCLEDETDKYLNRKEVQEALHARLIGVKEWTICSRVVRYQRKNLEIPMLPVLSKLVKSGIRILIYSGDQDSVIPLIGTRTIVNGLAKELGLNTTMPYRVWLQEKQVAGWTKVYGGGVLSYATIRGAGHEAPFSQPQRSLLLFSSFLGGKPLPEAVTH